MDNFTLTGGYNNGGGGYAAANFEDADESRPGAAYMESLGGTQDAIHGIVTQALQRHVSDTISPAASPMLTSSSNWRKRLREMMLRQNEQVLSFLFKPVGEHPTILKKL